MARAFRDLTDPFRVIAPPPAVKTSGKAPSVSSRSDGPQYSGGSSSVVRSLGMLGKLRKIMYTA